MMNWQSGIKVVLLLSIAAFCLSEFVLYSQSGIFQGFQIALLQTQWILLICISVWCGAFLFFTFSRNDLLLIGLLLIAISEYFIGYKAFWRESDVIIFLFGVTLGRGVGFALKEDGRWKMEDGENSLEIVNRKSAIVNFLVGLVGLLAFGSWWHLDVVRKFYPGTRWTGLWDNPNDYGLLMGTGLTLAIGLLAARSWKLGDGEFSQRQKAEGRMKDEEARSQKSGGGSRKILRFLAAIKSASGSWQSAILAVAAGMMAVGLLFSYSRGAWAGTAIGLLYLAKAYGKLKWRSLKVFLLSAFCFLFLIFGVWLFWNATPDSAPWYVKRLDLGRPSAQHRVAAWKAGFEMMRDHPFGVGWNKAVDVYQKNYSPPEDGAAAITTNDYLMLGTQLGWPGLLCFVAYAALCFRRAGQASCLYSRAHQRKYEALGHNSKAVHRAYSRKAKVELPSLGEYERQRKLSANGNRVEPAAQIVTA
jgi:hypothetical protein